MAETVSVLTWNVAGRLSRLDEQAGRVLAHRADVVCLQEVLPRALPRWTDALLAAGYALVASEVLRAAPRVHRLGVRGQRHDAAERMILAGPPGWRDAFRALHGFAARDRSWKVGRHPGSRLDHVLVSPGLRPVVCAYDHGVREDGLSDHSAMLATIAASPGPVGA